MPALVANYKKQETSTRLKKFYSMMSQAVLLSQNDNGEISGWSFPAFRNAADGERFFDEYLAPYLKHTSVKIADAGSIRFDLVNGDCVGMQALGTWAEFYYKISCKSIPGRTQFGFIIDKTGFYPSGTGDTREALKSVCTAAGNNCSKLIMFDGWEIKDDYPIKF
jgi:hypothetical protein